MRGWSRRAFLRGAAATLAGSCLGAAAPPSAHTRAIAYLRRRQGEDGAWRSGVYGALREGDALTPLALWALPDDAEPAKKGVRWLERLTARLQESAEPWRALAFPLFTAGYAAQVFARRGDETRAAFWAGVTEQLRLGPQLGWPEGDPACGAWSDSPAPPRWVATKGPIPDMLAPNLSATVLALQALAAAGRPGREDARPFLEQCQNFAVSPAPADDGGFFFTPGDPIRNKAGRAASAPDRFRSYGSATCDGLLALAACGVPADDPRRKAAEAWIRKHADGLRHGCEWPEDRRRAGEALRYYHAQALAGVLRMLELDAWVRGQRALLARQLQDRQGPDGSWVNAEPDSSEAEPLVATAFALHALGTMPLL